MMNRTYLYLGCWKIWAEVHVFESDVALDQPISRVVIQGCQHQRVLRPTIQDALEDVIMPLANASDERSLAVGPR